MNPSSGYWWTPADEGRLRFLWRDPNVEKRQIAEELGRSMAAVEDRASLMKLGPRPRKRVVKVKQAAPAPQPRRADREEREAAERQAERIRAYWHARGRTVTVDVVKVPAPPGAAVWSTRIVGEAPK